MISTMDSLNNSNNSHNTQTMSFKHTLKLHHNDNVIKTFNHSSKLAFKLAKTSCHISFLKSCRAFSITPKGLTLSDPLKSCRSHEILQKAQSLLVTSRLQQYKRDYATTESLYLCLFQQLQVSLNNTDHYEHILHLNSVKIDTTMQTFICKHSKKFQVLLDINNLHLVSLYNAFCYCILLLTNISIKKKNMYKAPKYIPVSPGVKFFVTSASSFPRAINTPLWRCGSTTTFFPPLIPPLPPPRPPPLPPRPPPPPSNCIQ